MRSVLLVRGTTWTRLRNLFDASLLMMTAGRFFLISPPMEGSKLIHQTSRRFMGYVLEGDLSPLYGLFLPLFVPCHLSVSRFQIRAYYMGAHQFFNQFTDFAGAY